MATSLWTSFVANDPSNQLLVSSSGDGVYWSPHTNVSESAGLGPSLALFNNRLFVCFVANDSSNQLLVSSSADGMNWAPHTAVPEASKFAPSLAVFNNRLFVCFVANDSSNQLLVSSSSDGVNWTPHTVIPEASQVAPSLLVFNNRLFVCFVANDSSNLLLVCSSADGATWTPHTVIPEASQVGPSLAVFNNRLFVCFVANDSSNQVLVCSSADGAFWTPPAGILEGSKFPPCLAPAPISALSPSWISYERTQSRSPLSLGAPQDLSQLIAMIQGGESSGRKVHAFGSAWSFSDCAITTDILVDTHSLNHPINTVQKAFNGFQPPFVYHVEAGITIHQLYTNLDGLVPPLALETMGGASGQTLAGAISTGTHGGDLFVPPIADSVLAIHLVGAGGAQYWIAPTAAITDKSLLRQFVAPDIPLENIIYDDDWFNAALVSLGCTGIIYAVVLRVRPQYSLIETTTATTWQDFKQTAGTLLQDRTFRFLQVTLNPYRDSNGNNFALLTRRREIPSLTDISLRWIASSQGVNSASGIVQKQGGKWPPPPTISLRGALPDLPIPPIQQSTGEVVNALLQLVGDLLKTNPLFTLQNLLQDLLQLLTNVAHELLAGHTPDPSEFINASALLIQLVNNILTESDFSRAQLLGILGNDYSQILAAYWPPGTIADKSFRVMDTTRFRSPLGPVDVDPPPVDPTGGYSIEILLSTQVTGGTPPEPYNLLFVDHLIELVNSAASTFLLGYVAVRFMGPTRALLGMQQWDQTCSVEISTLPNVTGEIDLLAAILDSIYDYPKADAPLPHWGQMLDSASMVPANPHFNVRQGSGDRYPNYAKWRKVYAALSNNFTTRTFANALSDRWQLTIPPNS